MFDDLRNKSASPFDEDVPLDEEAAAPAATTVVSPRRARNNSKGGGEVRLMGMTASQRLVISIMLFLNVAVLGCFLLLATGSVVPPF